MFHSLAGKPNIYSGAPSNGAVNSMDLMLASCTPAQARGRKLGKPPKHFNYLFLKERSMFYPAILDIARLV